MLVYIFYLGIFVYLYFIRRVKITVSSNQNLFRYMYSLQRVENVQWYTWILIGIQRFREHVLCRTKCHLMEIFGGTSEFLPILVQESYLDLENLVTLYFYKIA